MRIKVFIVCAIIWHIALSLFAQNKNDRFHMFGSERKGQINGYIGPLMAFSNVEGYSAIDAGATGGVIINNKYFIGLYGQKLLTKVPRTDLATLNYPDYTDGEVNMMHAGGVLGYIHKTKKVLNWGLSGSAGVGRIDIVAKGPINKYYDRIYEDKIIILVPKIILEANMTRWFKINVSGGYRLIGLMNSVYENQAGETVPTFVPSDYMKPEFSLSLLFGAFNLHPNLMD